MPPTARTATAVAAWLGALVVATGVGLAAVSAIGVGIIGGDQRVLSPSEVQTRLAAEAAAPTARPTTGPTSAPPTTADPGPAPQAFPTDGGTVVARCTDGELEIVSSSAAQGWRIHDEGERDRGRVRFESGDQRIELRFSCLGDVPIAQRHD